MTPAWGLRWRLAVFGALERLSAWRQHASSPGAGLRAEAAATPDESPPADAAEHQPAAPSLWVFVSTIGELNAIDPFLRRVLNELHTPALTLISDRSTYTAAYRSRYPLAAIEQLDGSVAAANALARRRPPAALVVAEIAALLHDAPCRLSYSTLRAAQRLGAPVLLVNGWLYGYDPPSRLDRLEQRWFAQAYVQALSLVLVQTEAVRERLLAAGARPEAVVVTGNIKFDAMSPGEAPATALSDALNDRRSQAPAAPLVVAGSVTETAQQALLIEAFSSLRQSHPQALLVLAPRHPENAERMAALTDLLNTSGLRWSLRSTAGDLAAVIAPGTGQAVLVLDTMGELRGCYAAAHLAFVGDDHNVLEPLAFGCPVFVAGRWEPTYPSYPVYRQLLDATVITGVTTAQALAQVWSQALAGGSADLAERQARLLHALAQTRGAVDRNIVAISASGWLQTARQRLAGAG